VAGNLGRFNLGADGNLGHAMDRRRLVNRAFAEGSDVMDQRPKTNALDRGASKNALHRPIAATLAIVLTSCASRPVNPAKSLTMPGVQVTRLDQQIAKDENLPFKGTLPQWRILRPGADAYVEAGHYACATAELRVSLAKQADVPSSGYPGCWQITRTIAVVTGAIAHVAESDYVVQILSDSGQTIYVGGDDVKPIIPKGTPLTIATTPPDCGSWDTDNPCGNATLVDASGNVICTLNGGEDAQLLDFRTDFEYHRLHVKIKDGRACPGYIGYMSELDVNEGSIFGFQDVQGARQGV
jgi:hypothetical protein